MNPLPLLAQRIFNVPLALHPAKAEIIVAALGHRFGVSHMFQTDTARMFHKEHAGPIFLFDDDPDDGVREKPYDIVSGVAILPVVGTLVHKLGCLTPYSGMTGYDGIRQNFVAAMADPMVRAIVLDIDSPGGEVSGCFDLVDMIYAARGPKPIHAIVNEVAYSAAYAIASAADWISVPRTGGVGSIGVICMHVDFSRALSEAGITVTLITYGDRKADGAETSPLSPEVKAILQADIDAIGELFCETVARNRSIASSAVRDTQAGIFLGAKAVAAGLANTVAAPDESFRDLIRR